MTGKKEAASKRTINTFAFSVKYFQIPLFALFQFLLLVAGIGSNILCDPEQNKVVVNGKWMDVIYMSKR